MATYTATVTWSRAPDETFTDGRFQRGHQWSFDGGLSFRASASPHVVPRYADPAGVDPEEAFVAALSSCHMLTFLYVAARAGHVVDSYEDTAEGIMAKTDGRVWVSQVILRPAVTWGGAAPDAGAQAALHHAAHDGCFIANSVKTEIVVHPR